MLFKQMAAAKEEVERPWQADIDQLQQTLQEVLQAISRLSGVELPGLIPDSRTPANDRPQLNCRTLKDRIRTELETFADATAAEMSSRAESQTRVALAAIHEEADGQVEHVARALREKLQAHLEPGKIEIGITEQTRDHVAELVQRRTDEFARWAWLMCKGTGASIPVQIQKLLEPYVEDATARFTESFRQHVQEQLDGHEQSARERLGGIFSSLEGKVSSLEQAAGEICERNAESASRLSAERLSAAGEEAVQNFEGRIQQQMGNAFEAFRTQLEQTAEASRQKMQQQQEEMAGALGRRMEELQLEFGKKTNGEISSQIEQVIASAIESAGRQLQQRAEEAVEHTKNELREFLEHQMENVRVSINALGESVQHSLMQEAERRETDLRKLEEEITGVRDRNQAEFQEQLAWMTSSALGSARERASQASQTQIVETEKLLSESREREAAQFGEQLRSITNTWRSSLAELIQAEVAKAGSRAASEVRENSASVLQELSDRVDASAVVLKEEEGRAAARMESLLKHSLEDYQQQLLQIGEAQLGEHRQAIRNSLNDLQGRLERSARAFQQSLAARTETNLSSLPHSPGDNGSHPSAPAD